MTTPVVAVAGYRQMHTLIAWLKAQTTEQGCDMLHLDSGTQRHRAHRFYFTHGMHVNCYHFAYLPG